MRSIATRQDTRAITPALGVILFVAITIALAVLIAPLAYNMVLVQEQPAGGSVVFDESQDGSVTVRVIDMGTADTIYINTSYLSREVTEPDQTIQIYPGEGEITVILSQGGQKAVAQTYSPEFGPDEPLAAINEGGTQKHPGQTYTLNASDSLGNITSYKWDINNDGTTDDTGETTSFSFANPGIYTVTLTVEDQTGRTHTTTQKITNTHLIVAQDGTGDYEVIQHAIDNASVGWSIYIKNTGYYEEQVHVNKDSLTLFSTDYATLNGKFFSDSTAGLTIDADNTHIRGLRIRTYESGPALTLTNNGTNANLTDLYVDDSGNTSVTSGALYVERGAHNLELRDSRVLSNNACGIVLGDSTATTGGPDNTIIDNTLIRSNYKSGLCIYDSVNNTTVKSSDFAYNGQSGALLHNDQNTTLTNSTFRRNAIRTNTDDPTILIDASQNPHLENLTLEENDNSGLTTKNSPTNLLFRDITINDSQGNGAVLEGVQGGSLIRFNVTNSTATGIQLDGSTIDLTIKKSTIQYNKHSGIYSTKYVNNTTIKNTTITYNNYHGVHIKRSDYIYFQDVNFTHNGQTLGEYHGLYLEVSGGDSSGITARYSAFWGTNNSEEDVVAKNSAKGIDARKNWWGDGSGPSPDQYDGNVTISSPCGDPDCSTQR